MAIAYGPASPGQIAAAMGRPRRHHHWLIAGGILLLFIVVLGVLGQASQPPAACTRSCPVPPPPQSPPVSYGTGYTSSRYHFSLAYDARYAGSPTSHGSDSIAWEFPLKSGGYLDAKVLGSASRGQSAAQAVTAAQSANVSGFRQIYSIPSAEVGYVPGAGAVYEGQWTPLMGSSTTERVAIISASKRGTTVTIICEAPKTGDSGGHPNPASLGLNAGQFCDQVGNTVTWSTRR